jgi:hypothetical protein
LNPKPTKFGDKDPTTVACRRKNDTLQNYQNDGTNDGYEMSNSKKRFFSGGQTLKKMIN